jgi:hypothetical protein
MPPYIASSACNTRYFPQVKNKPHFVLQYCEFIIVLGVDENNLFLIGPSGQ